ncbi:CPBP family intramembrane metalloprotease [Lactiplantibacillus garii]|uniref:CPBP family intramembrane metalloprotease n=1 Tax=Lactiplantibacillus garii TaxID=2306423 RepID=A0A3R8L2R7_9LACO|nr:CPBP family intramembrane glutamic endopeptidase [Lactiplantibacillus garii]RRK11281.1 CPBP family intramembrane metalloprotease [Lactiplantibacillus garii]
MHNFKRGFGLALLLFIWVIALFFASATFVSFGWVPMRYSGIVQDAIVLIGVGIFNHYLAHVPVLFWNRRNGWGQLEQAVPALLIVGLLVSANLPKLLTVHFQPLILLYLGYVILIGLTEEYVFRGVLIPLLARSFPNNNVVTVLLSSLLFGGLHIINSTHLSLTYVLPQILFAMAIGTLFAGVYIRTHNLGLTILMHAATDLSVVVQLVEHPTSSANLNLSPSVSIAVSIFYGLLLVIAILVAKRQTRHVKIPTELS